VVPIMTSNKQLHADRANAKHSTHPRSQAGKARLRLNSRKHGLTAKMLIIVGEDADQWKRCGRISWMSDPQSALESELEPQRLALSCGSSAPYRDLQFYDWIGIGSHSENTNGIN
jgi:hypothetical protein